MTEGRIVFEKFIVNNEAFVLLNNILFGSKSNMTTELDNVYFSGAEKPVEEIVTFLSDNPFPWNPIVSGYILSDGGQYTFQDGKWKHYSKKFISEFSDADLLKEMKRRGLQHSLQPPKNLNKEELIATIVGLQKCLKDIKGINKEPIKALKEDLLCVQKSLLDELVKTKNK